MAFSNATRPAAAVAANGPRKAHRAGNRIEDVVTRSAGETQHPVATPHPVLVTLRGRMSPDGYVPENDSWFDALTKSDDETGRTDHKGRPRRIGRDPMTIPLDTLAASGHPLRRTSRLVAALKTALDLDLSGYAMREYRDLRHYCLDCAENSAEVRRCA